MTCLHVPSVFVLEVGARAVRIASLLAAQRDAVRLAAREVGHRVVGPRARLRPASGSSCARPAPARGVRRARLRRSHRHRRPRTLASGRRLGEPEAALVLEDLREQAAEVQARVVAGRARGAQLRARRGSSTRRAVARRPGRSCPRRRPPRGHRRAESSGDSSSRRPLRGEGVCRAARAACRPLRR